MKPVVEKVLASGLVDKHTAALMERWGYLPEGASDKVNSDALKNATKAQLTKLAEEIGDEVAKENLLRETSLDLERLRWPTEVTIFNQKSETIVYKLKGMIDRMGRLYFRSQDIKESWFVPGYTLRRSAHDVNTGVEMVVREEILESGHLFIGDNPVAFQVTVRKSSDG